MIRPLRTDRPRPVKRQGQAVARRRLPFRGRRGSASALIVLMLVLLVFFGVLSLVTAAADSRLASRRAGWVREYYLADREAVFVVGELRSMLPATPAGDEAKKLSGEALIQQLQTHVEALESVELLEAADAEPVLAFRVWANEQAIEVGLRLVPPTSATESFQLEITRWGAWQQPFETDEAGGGVWNGEA